jgi:hypothetical protein
MKNAVTSLRLTEITETKKKTTVEYNIILCTHFSAELCDAMQGMSPDVGSACQNGIQKLVASYMHTTFLAHTKEDNSQSLHLSHFITNVYFFLRFEVFTAVPMKNAVFWDVTPCGCYKNDVSEERFASIITLTS